jgi:cytidylate kinase
MLLQTSSERLPEALAKAYLHWQTRREAARQSPAAGASPGFTIALSRQTGAGATSIAREVGARLNWPVYDQQLTQKIAEEMGLHAKLLEHVDERRGSWLEECLAALASGPMVTESAYVSRLVKTILSLAALGECVIVGRGAAHLLPVHSTLRVRLIAPREARIASERHRLGLAADAAAQWVDSTDRQRANFVRDHFQKDPADPQNYDLVLNSGRFSYAECADLIVAALRPLQTRAAKPRTPSI